MVIASDPMNTKLGTPVHQMRSQQSIVSFNSKWPEFSEPLILTKSPPFPSNPSPLASPSPIQSLFTDKNMPRRSHLDPFQLVVFSPIPLAAQIIIAKSYSDCRSVACQTCSSLFAISYNIHPLQYTWS